MEYRTPRGMMDVIVTRHAFYRMEDRGCSPKYVKEYLQKIRKVLLLRNEEGYVIYIHFKGRLSGIMEDDKFIVKTFLPPIHDKGDYLVSIRKSPFSIPIIVRKVLIKN
ncbi:MAG: hypothetical protein QXH91_03580 [Candidatus Bathyarchaeia archaeon]